MLYLNTHKGKEVANIERLYEDVGGIDLVWR